MILGHERAIRYLNRVIARGRLAHGYLFYGPDEAGNLNVAQSVAHALVCSHEGSEASLMGKDNGCEAYGRIAAGTHPAVVLLDLAHTLTSTKETRKEIPIDDIRELKRVFSFAPLEDAWRVAIIGQADTMSGDATDAFLKLLEEPGERTLFVLTAGNRESVAETIRSRIVPLGFFGETPVADEKAYAAVETALGAGIPEALGLSEKIAGDAPARAEAVAVVINILRAKMRAAAKPDEYRRAARRLRRVLDVADTMETTNVNTRLALDALFIESVRNL